MDRISVSYLVLINFLSILVTLYDKWASQHARRHRVRERHLFALALLGGALGMYASMQMIRHKTQHREFMWGLPLIFIIQIGLYIWVYD